MSTLAGRFDAVTFDFYNTLAFLRAGRGRGHILMEYFERSGLSADPWEHQVLYDVFAPGDITYDPAAHSDEKRRYRIYLAERVFDRLKVCTRTSSAADHADQMWDILGPKSLAVFPEVPNVLSALHSAGLPMAIVSNWQCGLESFCIDLGIGQMFQHILSSDEIGYTKPEPEIFHEACNRLGIPANRVLHIGDNPEDDLAGGRQAGVHVILVDRDRSQSDMVGHTIPSLTTVPELLGIR